VDDYHRQLGVILRGIAEVQQGLDQCLQNVTLTIDGYIFECQLACTTICIITNTPAANIVCGHYSTSTSSEIAHPHHASDCLHEQLNNVDGICVFAHAEELFDLMTTGTRNKLKQQSVKPVCHQHLRHHLVHHKVLTPGILLMHLAMQYPTELQAPSSSPSSLPTTGPQVITDFPSSSKPSPDILKIPSSRPTFRNLQMPMHMPTNLPVPSPSPLTRPSRSTRVIRADLPSSLPIKGAGGADPTYKPTTNASLTLPTIWEAPSTLPTSTIPPQVVVVPTECTV
jgi:hypothetical protein